MPYTVCLLRTFRVNTLPSYVVIAHYQINTVCFLVLLPFLYAPYITNVFV